MTIIELVIAFAVLMVVLVPVALLLGNVIGQAATSRERLTALSLAEEWIGKLNNTGPPLIDHTTVPETNVALTETANDKVSTITYKVYAMFTWSTAEGSHPDLCTSTAVPSVLALHVWVTWGHTQKITDTTIINYPPGGQLTNGFLAVVVNGDQVTDKTGHSWTNRVQAVPVLVTNTATTASFSETFYPTSYGCVFVQLQPGKYSIRASVPTPGTPSGLTVGPPDTPAWVANNDESATATSTAQTVSIDAVTKVTLLYDEGSSVSLSYPMSTATDGGVSCPGSAATTVQCLAFGQAPASTTTPGKTPRAELAVETSSGWSVTFPANVVRLSSAVCANRCIAVGAGKSGAASISSPTTGTPSFTADSVPSGVTALSTISCPTSTTCYATGWAGSVATVLSGTVSSSGVTWHKDTLVATTERITSLSCWTKTACYAIGTKKTGTGTVSELLSLTTSTKWTADTLPTTTTYKPSSLAQVACPATRTCYAVGTRKASAYGLEISLTTTTTKKWVKDTMSTSTVTSLSHLACPSSTVCYATGTRTTSSHTYGAIISRSAATTWTLDTPKTEATITTITCPSASACAVLATTTSAPVVLWGTGGASFSAESVPSTTYALTGLACASTSHCYAIGTKTTSAGALVLSGSSSSWVSDTLSTPTVSPVYYSGLACGSTCAVAGATETAPEYLTAGITGTQWTVGAASGVKGMVMGGTPITVTNTSLKPSTPLELALPSASAVRSTTGPLYPFTGGYSVSATYCATATASVLAATTPGGTSSVTLPMGLLPLRVVNKYGVPDTGATITVTLTCTKLTPLSGSGNPTSFAMASTGALGTSELALPFGKYTVTAVHSGHSASRTVTVEPSAITLTGVPTPLTTPVVLTET